MTKFGDQFKQFKDGAMTLAKLLKSFSEQKVNARKWHKK